MFDNRELKFKYHKPVDKDECVKAIYEELSEVESSDLQSRTLKTYIYEILQWLRRYERQQDDKKAQDNYNIGYSMGFLAFVAFVFIINGSRNDHDFSWLQQNSFSLKVWGLALASLYVGISMEKMSIFRNLWSFGFTKLVASISLSGLIVFCTGKAAGEINLIFGVDASAFPFTLAFVAGLLFFNYILPLVVLIALVVILFFSLDAIAWVKSKYNDDLSYDLPPVHSFIFPILASILLITLWGWSKNNLGYEQLPSKIYKLAHMLDFNKNHECAGIKEGVPVVFIGPAQSIVLADTHSSNIEDIRSFFEREVYVPASFYRLDCKVPEYSRQ